MIQDLLVSAQSTTLLFSLPHGVEWIIILLVVLVLFGNRLPSMARNLGRSFNEFKRGIKNNNDDPNALPKDPDAEKLSQEKAANRERSAP